MPFLHHVKTNMKIKNLLLTLGITFTVSGSVLSFGSKNTVQVKAEETATIEIITEIDNYNTYETNNFYQIATYSTVYKNVTLNWTQYNRIIAQPYINQDRTTSYYFITDTYTFLETNSEKKIQMYEYKFTIDHPNSFEEVTYTKAITYESAPSNDAVIPLIDEINANQEQQTDLSFNNVVNQTTWTETTKEEFTNVTNSYNTYIGYHTHIVQQDSYFRNIDNWTTYIENYAYIPFYKSANILTVPITVVVSTEQEIIDLPGLMIQIISMPFTFITTAFNVTIFPGTPYQVNIGNFILGIIALLTLLFIIKVFTGGLDVIGNINNTARNTTARWKSKSQEKLNKQTKLTNDSAKERK